MLAGETDFLLKIVAADWDSYQQFLSAKLTSAPNVSHVKSALTLRVSKHEPGVPIPDQPDRLEPDDPSRIRVSAHRHAPTLANRPPLRYPGSAVSALESAGGIVLFVAAAALVLANSPVLLALHQPPRPAAGDPGWRSRRRKAIAALGGRRADGDFLPARRARGQARGRRRRAVGPSRAVLPRSLRSAAWRPLPCLPA